MGVAAAYLTGSCGTPCKPRPCKRQRTADTAHSQPAQPQGDEGLRVTQHDSSAAAGGSVHGERGAGVRVAVDAHMSRQGVAGVDSTHIMCSMGGRVVWASAAS